MEVRLHDLATLAKRDGIEKHSTQPITDAAFHLRLDDVGIDGNAAIDGAPDLVHTRRTIGADGDFSDLGDERAEALDHRHAAGASFSERRPPIRHLGRLAQNTGMA
ncbi:hypothetical protein D9M72_609450 [compost metagenome]